MVLSFSTVNAFPNNKWEKEENEGDTEEGKGNWKLQTTVNVQVREVCTFISLYERERATITI